MAIQNINQNISAADQAAAANASMIVSGMERDLNKGKIKVDFKENQINLEQLDKFVKKLTDSSKIDPIKKDKEKKGGQAKAFQQKNASRPKAGATQKKKSRAYSWRGTTTPKPHGMIFTAGELDKFQLVKKIDPTLLQRFSVLYAKSLLKIIDASEQKELDAIIQEINLAELLDALMTRIEDYIFDELAFQIKKALLKQLKSPQKLLDFIIKFKASARLLNLAFFNEMIKSPAQIKQTKLIERLLQRYSEKNIRIEKENISELLKVAKDLGIESQSWIEFLKIDKIRINDQNELIIDNALLKAEREKELLLDEYRLLEVESFLSNKWKEKIVIYFRLRKVKQCLLEIGVSAEEIQEARVQARRLAWAKTIAQLKEEHLKRVFSSPREFGKISKKIIKMTLKARQLGFDISYEGVKWVETRLEKMAYDSASYKLELLKSMQSLDFDKQREKDLHQLNYTVSKLKQGLKDFQDVKADPKAYAPAV